MSTALPPRPVAPPAGWMEKRERSVARLLQHSILQLCNEHVGYSHRLQILGVLCMTVDDEQHELVVKVNNTLKRVNPTSTTPDFATSTPHPADHGDPSDPAGQTDHKAAAGGQTTTSGGSGGGGGGGTGATETPTQLNNRLSCSVGTPLTNGRRSHGRKGLNPVKVHHVYDAGEGVGYDEEEDEILTVMPTDPEASISTAMLTPIAPLPPPPPYRGSQSPAENDVDDDDDDEDDELDEDADGEEEEAEDSMRKRQTYQLRVPQVATYNEKAPTAAGAAAAAVAPPGGAGAEHVRALLCEPRGDLLGLTAALPGSDAAHYGGHDTFAGGGGGVGEMAIDYSRKSSSAGGESRAASPPPRLADLYGKVKEEPAAAVADFVYGLPTYTPSYVHSLLEASRLPGGGPSVLPMPYAGYPGFAPDPPPRPLAAAAAPPHGPGRVKDIILFDERSPLHLQKGARIEADYMVDKLGVEGRKRRRRAPDESLTAEEIAEYMGHAAATATTDGGNTAAAGAGVFRCQSCGDESNELTRYLRHTLAVHNAYVCHECGKSFTTKSSLLRHRPIHTGMRRFSCGICRKAFYRKDKCKAHIKRHLGGGAAASPSPAAHAKGAARAAAAAAATAHYQKIMPIA